MRNPEPSEATAAINVLREVGPPGIKLQEELGGGSSEGSDGGCTKSFFSPIGCILHNTDDIKTHIEDSLDVDNPEDDVDDVKHTLDDLKPTLHKIPDLLPEEPNDDPSKTASDSSTTPHSSTVTTGDVCSRPPTAKLKLPPTTSQSLALTWPSSLNVPHLTPSTFQTATGSTSGSRASGSHGGLGGLGRAGENPKNSTTITPGPLSTPSASAQAAHGAQSGDPTCVNSQNPDVSGVSCVCSTTSFGQPVVTSFGLPYNAGKLTVTDQCAEVTSYPFTN